MKFGKVEQPTKIDFSLPDDHSDTSKVLQHSNGSTSKVYVGCAKWNRKDLKKFYPRGIKDELEYYATQFNAIELNATFYRNFTADQVQAWYDKTPNHFRFFPKVQQRVSHLKWLNEFEEPTEKFLASVVNLKEKLGTIFLQMRANFSPKFLNRLQSFVEWWPEHIPLAVELRHPEWFANEKISGELYHILQENNVSNVLVDTAGRRDMMHMRLTNNEAFVRYVGSNHESDYSRLDDWVSRLKKWKDLGLQNIHFFIHQNEEKASPYLAAHFIQNLNSTIGTKLKIPDLPDNNQKKLY